MVKLTVQTPYCQKNSCTVSFSAIISVLSVLFYCAGFVRVELVISEQQKRIFKLEDVVEGLKLIANDGEANFFGNTIHGKIIFGSYLPTIYESIIHFRSKAKTE